MNIVADANIPMLETLFGHFGRITAIPGEEVDRNAVSRADILLVRSVTRIDSSLLSGSNVQFVGSATAGTDHVDVDYLKREHIAFASAPGSNADSVADYVIAALLELATITDLNLGGRSLGVIGVGAVGSRVAKRAAALGLKILLNDPPRTDAEPELAADPRFWPLDEILRRSDIVTVHVPLTHAGKHPTFHLLDAERLAQVRDGAWLVNTARGGVIDPDALVDRLSGERSLEVVLDVWPDEPTPDPQLSRLVRFGTPHIAGYASDSKIRGAWMIADSLARHLGSEARPLSQFLERDRIALPESCAAGGAQERRDKSPSTQRCMLECIRSIYDFREDYGRYAPLAGMEPVERAQAFRALRRAYPVRRTFNSVDLVVPDSGPRVSPELKGQLEEVLGVRVVQTVDH